MINFVPFYKDISLSKTHHKKLIKRLKGVDYKECLKILHDSFVYFNKDHKFIVQTDNTTELPYECYRSDLENLNLMESIIKSNYNFIQNNVGKTLLVGADHLIINKVDAFFEEDFDLGFYCKKEITKGATTNLSNTVVVVNSNLENHDRIINFFNQRYDIYKKYPPEYKGWWGDQLSLYSLLEDNVIKQYLENKRDDNIYSFNSLKIKIFEYNTEYLKSVGPSGKLYIPHESDIILDFPGGNSIKTLANDFYTKLVKNR